MEAPETKDEMCVIDWKRLIINMHILKEDLRRLIVRLPAEGLVPAFAVREAIERVTEMIACLDKVVVYASDREIEMLHAIKLRYSIIKSGLEGYLNQRGGNTWVQ